MLDNHVLGMLSNACDKICALAVNAHLHSTRRIRKGEEEETPNLQSTARLSSPAPTPRETPASGQRGSAQEGRGRTPGAEGDAPAARMAAPTRGRTSRGEGEPWHTLHENQDSGRNLSQQGRAHEAEVGDGVADQLATVAVNNAIHSLATHQYGRTLVMWCDAQAFSQRDWLIP